MTDKMKPENEADVLNQAKARPVSSGNGGGHPAYKIIRAEPIRKRGFYRALKRGEHWAVYKDAMDRIIKNLAAGLYNLKPGANDFFGRIDHERLDQDRPKTEMIGLSGWLPTNIEK